MGQPVKSIMTRNPIVLDARASVADAARRMADRDVGAVVIQEDGAVCGILTDRDIAVRVVARDQNPQTTEVGSVCSKDVLTLSPEDDSDRAVSLMSNSAIRRIPIVDAGRIVGMVSLGDLAQDRDGNSALGRISAATPNR